MFRENMEMPFPLETSTSVLLEEATGRARIPGRIRAGLWRSCGGTICECAAIMARGIGGTEGRDRKVTSPGQPTRRSAWDRAGLPGRRGPFVARLWLLALLACLLAFAPPPIAAASAIGQGPDNRADNAWIDPVQGVAEHRLHAPRRDGPEGADKDIPLVPGRDAEVLFGGGAHGDAAQEGSRPACGSDFDARAPPRRA